MDNPSKTVDSQKLAAISILTALSVGTNYAMISFSQVKFMDLIVFIGGFCFGAVAGSMIGVISWGIYGLLNPLGSLPVIWLSTMLSEPIYGIAGALLRKRLNFNEPNGLEPGSLTTRVFFGFFGMLLTFAYDLVTNVVFGYAYNMNILFAVILGFVPFGIVHMVSNACFFGLGGVPAINAILNFVGGEKPGLL